jgi:transposase
MKAYPHDLRQRVLRAIDTGTSQAEVAETFAASVATIKRYLKQRWELGHVFPKAIPGRPVKKAPHERLATCSVKTWCFWMRRVPTLP